MGTTPQGRGRYPEHDVLKEVDHWDDKTREVVLARVEQPPSFRFFTPLELATLQPFADLALGQDGEPRVPALAMVDAKLAAGKLDGYQHADMPDDRDAWRRAAAGLDESARARGANSFAGAPRALQIEIVQDLSEGKLEGGVWDEMPASKTWSVMMRMLLSEFYSHPWAWNEIGFGGPAYPRGYIRLGVGQRDAWEAPPASDADPVAENTPPAR